MSQAIVAKDMSQAIVIKGRYFWELVFSYDNSNNTKEIKHTFKVKTIRKINYKEMLKSNLNIKAGFIYENKSSISLKFEGYGGSLESKYNLHVDIASELSKNTETAEEIIQEEEVNREYIVGGGGKLNLYRLCYVTDGAIVKTDTLATSPEEDVIVDLKFTVTEYILGLREIIDQFHNTYPGVSNKQEWKAIREAIIKHSDRSDAKVFRYFVEELSKIKPINDNKDEWNGIRTTCSEILKDWEETNKQLLFNKLLTRFESTIPGEHNKDEWDVIRKRSKSILHSVKQTF